MKQTFFSSVLLVLACIFLAGCGGTSTPSSTATASGVKFRAFVSQDVSSSGTTAGLDIINASLDTLVRAPGVSTGGAPGRMAVANNKVLTLVFDASNNSVNAVNNKQETSAGNVVLPGWTESIAITTDATAGYAAVPGAPVAGQGTGAVEMLNLTNVSLEPQIPVPAVRYIVLSPDNTHLLAFSDNTDTATLITFTNVGTSTSPNWQLSTTSPPALVAGLNRPVWAEFSADSSTAYILNCGPECGGSAPASVSVLSLSNNPNLTLSGSVTLPGGATHGVLLGTILYVAGSAPGTTCGPTTAASFCGTLNVINVSNPSSPQVTNTVTITDGYHNRMGLTADNQVFIGAHNCSNVNTSTEQRGCLSIYNGNTNSVVIGTDLGDVTGIAPVTGRTEVYVVQNGELRIWDTTIDALRPPQNQIDLVGHAVDVKIVD
ncbi:MAG TPA: hypothetical protein VEV41_01465 [Terriglobales bacterium]|nr:hypothetical protein [Terriglobales bacterium]